MGQCEPSAILGITVRDIKNKKVSASKIRVRQMCVILAKINKFGERILIFRQKKSKTKKGQNDSFRPSNVIDIIVPSLCVVYVNSFDEMYFIITVVIKSNKMFI